MTARLLSVGVSKYLDRTLQTLPPCDEEAGAIAATLAEPEGLFRSAEGVVLTSSKEGANAIRSTIMSELMRICALSDRSDTVLFYFSGHGTTVGDEGYLLCQDTYCNQITETGLSISAVLRALRNSPAQFKIAVLDCCRPGLLIGKPTSETMSPQFESAIEKATTSTDSNGLAVLTACAASQVSHVLASGVRSVFTHFLLEGLKQPVQGEAELLNVQELYDGTLEKCRDWSRTNGLQQTPRLAVDAVGGASCIPIAKRRRPPLNAPIPMVVKDVVAYYRLLNTVTSEYPRKILSASDIPGAWMYSVIREPSYGGIDTEQRSIIQKNMGDSLRQRLARLGATLLSVYQPGSIIYGDSSTFVFPGGEASTSETSGSDRYTGTMTLEIAKSATSKQVLQHVSELVGWTELQVRPTKETTITLAKLVEHARTSGWQVTSFIPSTLAVIYIPGLGKGSQAASFTFRTERIGQEQLGEMVVDLRTVDKEHLMQSLLSEVDRLLSEFQQASLK